MDAKRSHFYSKTRRVAVKLWKANVSLNNIMKRLLMARSTLMYLLAQAKSQPDQHVKPWKVGSDSHLKIKNMDITLRATKRQLQRDPTLSAKQKKKLLPALENISIRTTYACIRPRFAC
jgi:hypothetical protein